MDKKAIKLTSEALIEAVLITIVIIAFAFYISSLREDTLIEKTAIIRELSMLANTVQASPQDALVIYNKNNLNKYHFSFKENYVQIKQQDYATVLYPYYTDMMLSMLLLDIEKKDQLVFSSFKDSFIISPETVVGFSSQRGDSFNPAAASGGIVIQNNQQKDPQLAASFANCPLIKSTVALQTIVLDSGKGDYIAMPDETQEVFVKDFGVQNKALGTSEHELTMKAVILLETALRLKVKNTLLKKTRTQNEDESFSYSERLQRFDADDNLVISIRMYQAQETENKITLYILAGKNELQNQKIACLLMNELQEKLSGLTHKIEIRYLAETDDSYPLLEKNSKENDNLAVLLELGNINNKDNALYSQLDAAVDAIAAAVAAYNNDR
ncbi:N-acetylmuramoyl-L-alanine amidase [Candidatus Woesearchaeota archaeon]|nr:N-acetylmuramoyl-L-alanine amidase [Candidatus Woesearchaeota archaeon]